MTAKTFKRFQRRATSVAVFFILGVIFLVAGGLIEFANLLPDVWAYISMGVAILSFAMTLVYIARCGSFKKFLGWFSAEVN